MCSSQMLQEMRARLVNADEAERFQAVMQANHYLGALRKIGETLWYVVTWHDEWVALLSFSAAALKCAARDQWIGWSQRQHYQRLQLVANNTRFCVLSKFRFPNVASRALALCERRLCADWAAAFAHPIFLLETFVDESRHGTVYLAANWQYVGKTQGYRRVTGGYTSTNESPKKVFLRSLHPRARTVLTQPVLDTRQSGQIKPLLLVLSSAQLCALPPFFSDVPDPRTATGRRYTLSSVLAIAAGAYLCGARSVLAMSEWAQGLNQTLRQGLRCPSEGSHYLVPSILVISKTLKRVDRGHLQRALDRWNDRFGVCDASLILNARQLCMDDGERRRSF